MTLRSWQVKGRVSPAHREAPRESTGGQADGTGTARSSDLTGKICFSVKQMQEKAMAGDIA